MRGQQKEDGERNAERKNQENGKETARNCGEPKAAGNIPTINSAAAQGWTA